LIKEFFEEGDQPALKLRLAKQASGVRLLRKEWETRNEVTQFRLAERGEGEKGGQGDKKLSQLRVLCSKNRCSEH